MRHGSGRIVALIVAIGYVLAAAGPAQAQQPERCFPETGFCVAGPIREFWERNGGLAVFGFPITPQFEEQVEGQPLQVQWFERNRLELHPENAPPYHVLLGRLGADRLVRQGRDWFAFPRAEPQPGCRFFPETGHNVCGEILSAWRANGLEFDGRGGTSEAESLALFGMPLSEAQPEIVEGREYLVQWFERARFELHPENAPPYHVLLGRLGDEIRNAEAPPPPPAGDPCAGVPDPVSARVYPAKCVPEGQPITIDIFGFQPDEHVGYWLTAPDDRIVSTDEIASVGPTAGIDALPINTGDLSPGLWFWVFQGASSNHQAIVHVQIIAGPASPSPPPPPPPPPASLRYVVEWEPPQSIAGPGDRSLFPWTAIDSNNRTHVVYSTGDGGLWYTNDVRGGFGAPQLIENGVGSNREPFYALAIGPGDRLHLAYAVPGADRQIYYRQAVLEGDRAAWSGPELISDGGAKSLGAHLAVDGANNAHIVWVDNRCGAYNVFYRVRRGDGSLSEVSAPLADCAYQNRPQIALTSDGKAHVVFQREKEIFYARLEPHGWVNRDISESPAFNSLNPSLTSDGAGLYVVWDEGVNGHDILFRRSIDGGQNWSNIVAFSDTPAFASFPHITYSPASRLVYAVWADATDGAGAQPDIWYREFNPAIGATSPPLRLAITPGSSLLAVIGAGPARAAVVWQDKTAGDWQIDQIGGRIVGVPDG